MNLVAHALTLVSRKEEDPRDVIASLLMAAREDKELRKQMLFLLTAPSVHRQSLVNTALHEMKLRRESKGVSAAFAVLATDDGARTALDILRKK